MTLRRSFWRRIVARRNLVGALGAALLLASPLSAQTLVLEDLLQTATSGTRAGGAFDSGGWRVTGHNDHIYWHIPTVSHGAAEWEVRGLGPNEGRPGMEDKAEIFHMYDYTFGNSDTAYNGGYRDNPYKHFVRKIGTVGGNTNAVELVWQILPNYHEPDTPVLSWNAGTTYRFREEWGPDGSGNSYLRFYRDGVMLRETGVPGVWSPQGHSIRIAASPRSFGAPDAGAPMDAVFSNLRVWNMAVTETLPLPERRTGEVSLDGHALQDNGGEFLGLGVSYFQALRRTKFDRGRYRSDLDFLARRGFNYIRALSMVGWYDAWEGREIAPVTFQNENGQTVQGWSDYAQQLRDMIDIAYDEYGIRTQLTVFADAQLMPTQAARQAHMDGVLAAISGREHKVIMLEVANEYWQNGFADPQGTTEVRAAGQYLADRTDVLISLSSPPEGNAAGLQRMYQGSAADIATQHFSRDISAPEGGWRPVRDPWWVNSTTGVPPASSNEPIGPGSSVSTENDPIKLVSAAAYSWMSGLPMYVYHTNAGVFGQTRFEDMAGVSNYRHLSKILPGDIAKWPQRTEGKDAFAPFTTYAGGQANRWWTEVGGTTTGVLRHLSNVNGDQFYTLPIAVQSGGVQLAAKQHMSMQVFNPLTGEVVSESTPSANAQFTIPQGPGAYIIKGRYAGTIGSRPMTIDLGATNDIDGMTHPRSGDGDTVAETVGGRDARKNTNSANDFYMYFGVADWFAHQASRQDLYIAVQYYDSAAGSLTLQYDSNTGGAPAAFYKNGGSVAFGGTNTWKQHTFHVTDAYFGNRQNHSADFRIFGGVGNTFYLDKVIVSLTEPPLPPERMAFTDFNEPALDAGSFTPGAGQIEMGFQTVVHATGGQNPLAAVAASTTSPTSPVFSHRSVDATTTFETIDLVQHDDVRVSLIARVRETIYEVGDRVRIFVTNGIDAIDLLNETGTALNALSTLEYQTYAADIPDEWTQATLVISSLSNSGQGSERYDIDSVLFEGVPLSDPFMAGDIDLDGDVDRADLSKFLRQFGRTAASLWTLGDFDGDRATTARDLVLLQQNFGMAGPAQSAAVPEPSAAVPEPSAALLACAGMFCWSVSRQRGRWVRRFAASVLCK